ncbi:carbohydrate ABC transporter permease [Rhizobium jaguaris]|uniref:Carbohydrate ABC transporter permease n=1 Tax=Rhizobium jaguaris TaxID=1312183 RepID=A0A387FW75_9HYPH|nr:carbohydrate ABC transporter permease [Rhizobium jaguaris]AYG62643.1 carbohydrate ABC transporter permease [Rhizobium jaguaris]
MATRQWHRTGEGILRILAYLGMAFALFITIFPIYWLAQNSFKRDIDIFAVPPVWFDFPPTLMHYEAAFIGQPFLIYALNSFLIAVATTIVSLIFGTMAGYALARFEYPGRWRYQISFWILSTRMMPPIATIIPLFIFFNFFNLLNTKLAVVVAYTAFNLPFVTWMMKSYFQDLPPELEESAMVDGDTRWGAFLRIALPLARPGIAATAIFSLILSWNEFLLALILTQTERSVTLPVGISGRVTQYTTHWGEISAAGFLASVPIIVFALIVQKHLVRGLSLGAVKG